MKRHISIVSGLLFLGLAACGTDGMISALQTWDELCGCWVYLDVAAHPLLEEGFESGIRPDRWVVEGAPASIDAREGAPAPSMTFDGPAGGAPGSLTTATPFPLEAGLQIGLFVSPRGVEGRLGETNLRIRDGFTGDEVASVRMVFATDGGAALTYRLSPPGAPAVESTELLAAADLGTGFRQIAFAITPDGGSAWYADRVARIASPSPMPSALGTLTLESVDSATRFDSIRIAVPH